MRKAEKHPLPSKMKIDKRPMDKGEFQPWGYGYSRKVGKRELWRPATRYFQRKDKKFCNYQEIKLMPDAYWVSDHGRIYSAYEGGIINTSRKHRRRRTGLLAANGSILLIRPYKLALDNWIEPPKIIRSCVRFLLNTVNHKDGKPWNDHLDNLQYSSRSDNCEHQGKVLHRSGRRKDQPTSTRKKRRTQNGKTNSIT